MRSGLIFIAFLLLSFLGYGQNCTLTVSLTSTAPAICSGNSVTVTASASSGTEPYAYTWNTGQTTAAISVNKAGNYSVTVTDAKGCQAKNTITVTATATPPASTVADVAVCPNTSATLTATAPGGVYQWYDADGKFLFTGATYTTQPISTRTVFYVEATVGGCTGPRKAVTVFVYGPPGAPNAGICERGAATLNASPGYNSYSWYDVPAGGSPLSTSQSFTTPVLSATTTYYVSGVINGCTTGRTPVTVFVTAAPQPPTVSDATICSGSRATLHADAPAGNIDWFDVPVGGTSLITSPDFTTPALTAGKTYYVQVTTGCVSTRRAVTVNVNQIPQAPTPGPVPTVCTGSSVTLTASGSLGVIEWYSRASGGTLLFTGNSYNTPALTRTTTYYVQANNSGCVSTRVPITVRPTTPPPAPTASPSLICPNTAATLTATAPGGTYNWYDVSAGGTPLFTGDTFVTPTLSADKTYYVEVVSATGCISERTAVDVTLLPVTSPPSASGTLICAGNTATLTASGAGNYQWYNAATAGNKLSDGQVFVTPALTTTTTYYVQTISPNGCESARTPVTVTVNAVPAQPTANPSTAVCPNSSATLSVTPVAGVTVSWYSAATGGTPLASGNSFTTPPLSSNTTYYAEASNGSCTSVRTAVQATLVVGTSPQYQYPFSTVCTGLGTIAPVINNPAGGTFSASSAGLVFVSTSTGEINVSASTPGTYTISFAGNGSCSGVSSSRFTIGGTIDAQFSYASPFCQGGANPVPVFPGAYSAGSFSATPAGLVFANSSTGEIDLARSAPGTYTITNFIGGGGSCQPSSATYTVIINQAVTVNAGPPQTVQAGSPVQLSGSITGGTTSGTWSGGGGSFSNVSSPTAVYTPALGESSATLTLTSADPAGPCGPASAQVIITFSPAPPAPTASGATICAGNAITLSATAPGGTYQWYSSATGGTPLATGPAFTTPVLTASTTYYVSTTLNGATSARTAVPVTVTPPPSAPVVAGLVGTCSGSTATLTVSNPNAAYTYEWYNAAAGGNRLASAPTFTTRRLSANATYYVQAIGNGCTSPRTPVQVTVSAVPTITSGDDSGCSGVPLNYTIASDLDNTGTTFIWSRTANPDISNPAVNNQTSSKITETLINTSPNPVDVIYNIAAVTNGCTGPVAAITITVFPAANVTSAATIPPVCNGNSTNYTITFDSPVSMSWSRAAVPGISNAPVSDQAVNVLREVLFNTTNAPVNVGYVFNYTVGACTKTFTLPVTVNPPVNITSEAEGNACSGLPEAYQIKSNIAAATFRWSRSAVTGVSNAAVSNQTGANINENLVNTTTNPVKVDYVIVPTAFGCDGPSFTYQVTVNPIPAKPNPVSNSPVCVAGTILLNTEAVDNAIYMWTGPNGFKSSEQSPQIPASVAASGTYFLTVVVNGCSSPQGSTDVQVNPPPTARAGRDTTICIGTTALRLAGQIGGGTTTGMWSSSGSGTFTPAANNLNAQYLPSAQDKAVGSFTLTLTSTSTDDCAAASSSRTVTFGLNPASDAGPDQELCAQTTAVALSARILAGTKGIWSTSGTGSFNPSPNAPNTTYIPGFADAGKGKVVLTFTVLDAGACYLAADSLVVNLIPPPTLNAGGTRYVRLGHQITLTPTVSDENVIYRWAPAIGLSNPTIKNPVLTADSERVYTLTVTDSRGCVTADQTTIRLASDVMIYNTFTPNGDGVNDFWNVTGLIAFEDAVIDVYTRNGVPVFHSVGYNVPWDGSSNGRPVPAGVYYYVIDTKNSEPKKTGWVTVIR